LIGSLPLASARAADVPRITTDALEAALGDPELVVLDVRQGNDWESSEFKIKGAVRAAPDRFESWRNTFDKEKRIVLYCA
jgi:rhodanese-related sulfurtransferase